MTDAAHVLLCDVAGALSAADIGLGSSVNAHVILEVFELARS